MGIALESNPPNPPGNAPPPTISPHQHSNATNDLQSHFECICALQSDITFDHEPFHSETIPIDKALIPILKLDDEDQQIDGKYGGNGRTKWTKSPVV